MKVLNFLKDNWSIVLFLLINLYSHKEWVLNNNYLTNGDSGIYLYSKSNELISDSFSVFDTKGLGSFDITMSSKPLVLLHGLLYQIGLDYNNSFKLIYAFPIIIIGPLGLFFFLKKNLNFSNSSIFVILFLFFYNSYFVILQTGHLMLAGAISYTGFSLHYFHEYLKKLEIKFIYSLIFLLFIISVYDLRILIVLLMNFFIIFLYVFSQKELRDCLNFKKVIFNFSFLLVVLFLLNFFWIMPTYYSEKLFSNSILNRGLFGNQFFNMIYSLTISHAMWDGKSFVAFSSQAVSPLSFIIPTVLVLSFIFIKKDKVKEFYGYFLVLLFGILLTKQSAIPFPQLYNFFFENVPGFKLYREASKFYILLMVGYSVAIGFFLEYLKSLKFLKLYYIILIIIIFNFSSALNALVTGTVSEMFVQRQVPNSYLVLNDSLNLNSKFGRVVWIPSRSRWGFETNLMPGLDYVALKDLKQLFGYNDLKLNFDNISNNEKLIDYFKYLSIKYVVITRIDKNFVDEDNFYNFYSGNKSFESSELVRDSFLNQLDKVSFLKKKNIGNSEIFLFENENNISQFYEVNDTSLLPLNFISYSNNKKSTDIELNTDFKDIIFSTNYDTNWKFYITSLNSINIFPECKIKNENISIGKYNTMSIKLIKEEVNNISDKCIDKKNLEKLDFRIISYYQPQDFYIIGLVVSIISFILLLFLILNNFFIKKV